MSIKKSAGLLAFALVATIVTGSVFGAQAVPKVLHGALGAGVEVVKQFRAASELTGWVLSRGGKYSLVYTTADRKTLIAGALINERGENLSALDEAAQLPQPDLTEAFRQIETTSYIAEGRAGNPNNVIYAFVDANCPYCHYLWQALQPYQAAGLQVRWIPVAVLGPTSMPKAVAILASQDKAGAFRNMEENHGKPWTAPAGISATSHPAIVAAVEKNGAAMASFGIAGMPGVVWRNNQGQVRVKSGMPRLSELPGMTGLAEQRNTTPGLEKFR